MQWGMKYVSANALRVLTYPETELDAVSKSRYSNIEFSRQRIQSIRGQGTGKISFAHCELRECFILDYINQAEFDDCTFIDCDFNFYVGKEVRTSSVSQTKFEQCTFVNCHFSGVEFHAVEFENCTFQRATFSATSSVSVVRMLGVEGIETCRGLHLVRDDDKVERGRIDLNHSLISLPLPWLERHASWERLRTFGKLPLFGVSFSALVAIPALTFGLAVYNEQVRKLTALPQQHADLPPQIAHVLANLHIVPLPSLSLWLLISTVLLGIASTIYALGCPSRIKEFSRDQWQDELGKAAVNYLPLSWTNRPARLIAYSCYIVGGLGTGLVLIAKIANAARYIWENSTFQFWV